MVGFIRAKWWVSSLSALLLGAALGMYLGFMIFAGDGTSNITPKKKDREVTNSYQDISDYLLPVYYPETVLQDETSQESQVDASLSDNNGQGFENSDQRHSIVFIKTHKTGSSTIASILQRYGFAHNMTFLVPSIGSFINYVEKFSARRISHPKWRDTLSNVTLSGYELLANHARYSRQEMSTVFTRKTHYITILRDPVEQFESAFYYFDIPDALPTGAKTLSDFMKNPMGNFFEVQKKRQYFKECLYNEHLFDLGLDHADMFRPDVIDAKISEIDKNFDLVMLCEYFEESLVLLRKLLNWNTDDMVYLVKGARVSKFNHKDELTPELRARIRAWNAGDVKLYAHFNRTFWRKVAKYGPTFATDLAELRVKLADAVDTCYNTSQSYTFIRESHNVLRKDAPQWCKDADRSDYDFTAMIRKRMKERGVPLYDFQENVPQRKSVSVNKSSVKSKT